jgi:hypothetical protein
MTRAQPGRSTRIRTPIAPFTVENRQFSLTRGYALRRGRCFGGLLAASGLEAALRVQHGWNVSLDSDHARHGF